MKTLRSVSEISRLVLRHPAVLLLIAALAAMLAALVSLAPRHFTVSAAATPATGAVTDQLITQQGSGVLKSFGDFIASSQAAPPPGLNSPYRYYIEVPPGLASLQVDLFDRDVGAGATDVANDRDRNIGAFNTCARYQLFRPDGTLATTAVHGTAAGCVLVPAACPAPCDNAWGNFSTQATPAAGHWELRVDMSSAVTTGDDINAFGIRAHDGTPGAGGTELNVYAESFYIIGVNQNGRARSYSLYPYITSGCTADANDFDYDTNQPDPPGPIGPPYGSLSVTRRGGGYTHTNATMSNDNVWQNVPFTGWTNDQNSIGYGLWTGAMSIEDWGSGNYGPFYFGSFAAANPPPTSQPQAGTFRMYLPTDAGAAPVRPYVEQLLRVNSGPNPPLVGQTTQMTVTVRLVNPALLAVTFSTPTNVVTANVPGAGAVYAGSLQMSQGALVSQPALGGTGNVVWNPGSLAAGATALLAYRVNVTPTAAGQRIPVTGTPASNGTTARYLDDTGNATQARATYTFGPLCELAAQQGVLTHALVSSFRALSEGAGVRVVWETATEVGTVSFQLYRYETRERKWVEVNEEPRLASPGSPQGARYELLDPAAPASGEIYYALLERTFEGRDLVHGPYVVSVESGSDDSRAERRPRATRVRHVERMKASASRRSLDSGRSSRARPIGGAIQILVRERGLYYLDASRIAELAGMPDTWVRALVRQRRLSLSNRGLRVAWHPAPGEGGLYFYGEGLESPYTDDNVYWLEPGDGLSMATVASEPSSAEGGGTFSEILRREEDRFAGTAASRDPDSDFWYWDVLFAGDPSLSSKRFDLPAYGVAPTGATASIEVELQGATESGPRDEHHVLVSLNGVPVGETRFDGLARHRFELAFPQRLLVEGRNEVELTGLLDEGVAQSVLYVDSFALRYSKLYRADRPAFFFGSGENRVVSIDGFQEPTVSLLDLSDPWRPAFVSGAKVERSDSGYRATFSPPTRNAPFLALTPSGVMAPMVLTADVPSRLRSSRNGADYLVIAPEELARGARELARYRRGRGLRTEVVLAEDVMDEFNFGIQSPHALRDFLGHVHRNWSRRPRYVVLVGKGTFDYKNVLGQGDNRLPPVMAATDNGLFASDVRLADVLGEDGVPEFAIGRIPALSDDEVLAYVARMREQESAPPDSWMSRVLIAADRPQGGANFQADAEALAGLLPSGYEASKVYLSDQLPVGEARERLFDELEEGVSLVTYVGHGALDRFSSEALLTVADVKTIENRGRRPIVTAWTCNAGRFDLPGFVSLGEELVLANEGGASAVWAPTGLSDNVQARWLSEEFFRTTFQGGDERLGDALLRTLKAFEARGASKSMLWIYQLLGDPALSIRRPETQ